MDQGWGSTRRKRRYPLLPPDKKEREAVSDGGSLVLSPQAAQIRRDRREATSAPTEEGVPGGGRRGASAATRCCRPKKRKGKPYRMAATWYLPCSARQIRRVDHEQPAPTRARPHAGVAPLLVPVAGVEPARVISPKDFESSSSANSNTPACPHIIAQARDKVKNRRQKTGPFFLLDFRLRPFLFCKCQFTS